MNVTFVEITIVSIKLRHNPYSSITIQFNCATHSGKRHKVIIEFPL